jgi:membrane associated rhomboid family serine protease
VRRLSREPITLLLVALCVAWTLLAMHYGLSYLKAGALTGRRLWEGEYWRLFSAMFLHHMGSWIHLVANSLSLFFVGRVIERGCGRRTFLLCLFGGAMAGFAASLLFHPDPRMVRVGISGGIAGLIGLLLAVEWALTKSLWDFLRQRNTLLIAFFLALSFPLAWLLGDTLNVDHAGHAGGFAFGLLFGLARYTRRGMRPVRGRVVALALAVLPLAYACHPFLDPDYQLWRARRAYLAGDFDEAARRYERAGRLDPAALDGGGAREELLDAYLRLAERQLDGPGARKLMDAALAVGGRDPVPWFRFAEAAEARQRPDEAYVAWREAAALLPDSETWRADGRALRLLVARPEPPLLETIAVVRSTMRGLNALPEAPRAALEQEIAAAADALSARALVGPSGEGVANGLAGLYATLAENAARRPRYRLRSAEWLWRASEGPIVPEEVVAQFRAALTEAALYGDPAAREAAARWFRDRGMPVPEPDLEGEEGGG